MSPAQPSTQAQPLHTAAGGLHNSPTYKFPPPQLEEDEDIEANSGTAPALT